MPWSKKPIETKWINLKNSSEFSSLSAQFRLSLHSASSHCIQGQIFTKTITFCLAPHRTDYFPGSKNEFRPKRYQRKFIIKIHRNPKRQCFRETKNKQWKTKSCLSLALQKYNFRRKSYIICKERTNYMLKLRWTRSQPIMWAFLRLFTMGPFSLIEDSRRRGISPPPT